MLAGARGGGYSFAVNQSDKTAMGFESGTVGVEDVITARPNAF